MKKLLSVLPFIFLFTALSAQQIPNGSFRYWGSPYAPNGWGTWATALSNINVSTAASLSKLAQRDTFAGDYITDSSTLRLTVDTATFPFQGTVRLAGFASLGGAFYAAPPAGSGLQYGYMPYTRKPDTLYADYKLIPAAGFNDTALIVVALTKWDTLTHSRLPILSVSLELSASSLWRRNVAFPIGDYYNTLLPDSLPPDSMQVIVYSSVSVAPSQGTTLWIDSMRFDASVNPVATSITDVSKIRGVAIYPNPASDKLEIGVEEKEIGSALTLFNSSGQNVYAGRLQRPLSEIDTRSLPAGTYTLRIHSTDHLTIFRTTVTIVH
jgi:hypothetical protein